MCGESWKWETKDLKKVGLVCKWANEKENMGNIKSEHKGGWSPYDSIS